MGRLGASLGSGVGVGDVSGTLGSKGWAERWLSSHFPILGLGSERQFGGGRLSIKLKSSMFLRPPGTFVFSIRTLSEGGLEPKRASFGLVWSVLAHQVV